MSDIPADVIEKALRKRMRLRTGDMMSGAEVQDAALIALDALAGAGLVVVPVTVEEGLADHLADLIPDGMTIWEDDDELDYFADRDLSWWMKALGHDRLHTACCTSCGCCTTCIAQMFHRAMVASVIRELGKLGALREPAAQPEETTDHV